MQETFAAKLHIATKMQRVIIFCQLLNDCSAMYEFFLSILKHEFTEPMVGMGMRLPILSCKERRRLDTSALASIGATLLRLAKEFRKC